jgi:flagellar assembly factor FliW
MERSHTSTTARVIVTPEFGEILIDETNIFSFPEGLIGMEHLHDFVVIQDESMEPVQHLISIDDPTIGFMTLHPLIVDFERGYFVDEDGDRYRYFPMVTVSRDTDSDRLRANMDTPIILDTVERTGKQLVLDHEDLKADFFLGEMLNTAIAA